jgi:hypothetical protein
LIDGWIRCLIPVAEDKSGLLFSNLKPLDLDPVALDDEVGKKLLAVRQGKNNMKLIIFGFQKWHFFVEPHSLLSF